MSSADSKHVDDSKHKKLKTRFANITVNNIGQVKKLNRVIFPVRYGNTFYKQILQKENKPIVKLGTENWFCFR